MIYGDCDRQRSALDGHSNFEGRMLDTRPGPSLSRTLQGPDDRKESVVPLGPQPEGCGSVGRSRDLTRRAGGRPGWRRWTVACAASNPIAQPPIAQQDGPVGGPNGVVLVEFCGMPRRSPRRSRALIRLVFGTQNGNYGLAVRIRSR